MKIFDVVFSHHNNGKTVERKIVANDMDEAKEIATKFRGPRDDVGLTISPTNIDIIGKSEALVI